MKAKDAPDELEEMLHGAGFAVKEHLNAAGKAARETEEADEEELEEGTGRWGEDIVRRFEARYGTEYNADGTKKGSSTKDSGKKP